MTYAIVLYVVVLAGFEGMKKTRIEMTYADQQEEMQEENQSDVYGTYQNSGGSLGKKPHRQNEKTALCLSGHI